MRIAFITTAEPFYLPEFFDFLFKNMHGSHDIRLIIVPPIYKGSSRHGLAVRYMRTFGFVEAIRLTSKLIFYKLMNHLPQSLNGSFYSLPKVLTQHRVPYELVQDVNGTQNLEQLRKWPTDLIISISCPQIFGTALIKIPSRGCLNLHGAILPKYRGVMPSFWMLANNEKEGGLTLFFVNEKIDAGEILVQRRYPICADDTLDALIRKSKRIGAEMVLEGIEKIDKANFDTRSFDLQAGSYFGWPKREDVLRFLTTGRRFR